MVTLSFRKMKMEDLPDVMAIDLDAFPSPWTREVYEQELLKNDFAHYFVLQTDDGKIVGYVGLWIVFEDAQITNIAVHKDFRGKRIGERLFGYALAFAFYQGAQTLSLEVRPSNTVAKNMYRKFGLKEGGIRKNYYPDNGEDAIVMWVNLTDIKFENFINETTR